MAGWSPRCMFAATAKPLSQTNFGAESLWICGGTRHPYRGDVAADLWFSDDGKKWENQTSNLPFPGGDMGTVLGPPLGAALLYDEKDQYLILAGAFRGSGGIAASRNYLSLAWDGKFAWMKHDSRLTGSWSDPFF